MAKKYNDFGFMQWFYDLTTMKKMLVLIAFMTVAMIAIGGTGLYFNVKANESTSIIYEDNLKPVRWINLARIHLNANRTNLYHAISNIGYDSNKVREFVSDIDNRSKDVDENLDNVKEKLEKLNDKIALDELGDLQKYLEKYREGRAESIKYILAGQKMKALQLAEAQRDNAFKVVEHVTIVASKIQQRAEKRNSQALIDKKIAESTIAIVFFVSLGLCLFLGWVTADRIAGILGDLGERLQAIAKGDLTVEKLGRPEGSCIGDLCVVFDTMFGNLRELVEGVTEATVEVTSGVQEVAAATEQASEGAQQVSKSIEQVAAGSQQVATNITQLAAGAEEQSRNVTKSLENINNVNSAVDEILKETEGTSTLSKSTESNAAAGYKLSQDAVQKINEIKTVSNQISGTINELGTLSNSIEEIVDMIKGIASQTNLLALNAAIEAARAGEHGKGFAVVAEEVKSLAGESAEATDKITEMIKEIQAKTSDAVNVMDCAIEEVDSGVAIVSNVGTSLEEIVTAAKETNGNVDVITNAVNELAKNSNNVVQLMEELSSVAQESTASTEDISSITEETAASVEEVSANVEEQGASLEEINASMGSVASTADKLQVLVNKFQL